MAYKLLALIILAISFFPLLALNPELKGVQGLLPPEQWLLGTFIVASLSFFVCSLPPNRIGDFGRRVTTRLLEMELSVLGVSLFILLLTITGLIFYSFDASYHLVDTIAQVFQAKIFASGQLVAKAPAVPEFFITQNMLIESGKWYSQYPPGHALLLSLGESLSLPWLIPILLSAGTVFFIWSFTRRAFGRGCALVSLLLSLSSPFLLFMGGSYMNHVSAAFFLSIALDSLSRWELGGRKKWLLATGFACGGAILIRPYSSLVLSLALLLLFIIRRGERKLRLSVLPWLAAGPLISGFLFLSYNLQTTGDAFLLGYTKLWGRGHGIGFHQTPWGEGHTLLKGLLNQLADIQLLNEYLLGWPLPSLLVLSLFLISYRGGSIWFDRLLLGCISLPMAQVFYWHRDQFLGPRFLYELLPFLLPVLSYSVVKLCMVGLELGSKRRAPMLRIQGCYFVAMVFLSVLHSLVVSIPVSANVYRSSLSSQKIDLLEPLKDQGISQGLVFVSVSWGDRILARLRGLGVSASLSEQVYRAVDHCLLYELLESSSNSLSLEDLENRLWELISEEQVLIRTSRVNGDPSLRLRPNVPLRRACSEEISYDRKGYLTYTAGLLENSPNLDGNFIVARDLREHNVRLQQEYPEKQSYLIRPGAISRLEDLDEK